MIEGLFASKTTEKVLLYLAAMGKAYPAEVSKAFKISNTQTIRSFERLENYDILVSISHGRIRVYQLNTKWFLFEQLKALLDKALLHIPIEEQMIYFAKRKKPRKKNKL